MEGIFDDSRFMAMVMARNELCVDNPILENQGQSQSKVNRSTDFEEYDDEDETDTVVEKTIDMYSSYPSLCYLITSYEKRINEEIIGQEEAVKKLVYVAYYNQYLNFVEDCIERNSGKRKTMLMIAPTGNGKTALMRAFEEVFKVPVYLANITATTSSGYVGENVEDMLYGLYEKADCDMLKAQNGVLFIDEIDKKASCISNDGRDVAGRAVQQELLKILEPNIVNISPNKKHSDSERLLFNTKYLTVILGGAFVGLNEIRKKRLNKMSLGFMPSVKSFEPEEYTHEDLINYGFIPEFAGRIDVIQEFRKLTTTDIKDIIFSPHSTFQQNIMILRSLGVIEQRVDGFLYEKIAGYVVDSSMGVRTLNRIISDIFTPIIYETFQHTGEYSKVYIDENGRYTLTYGNKKVYKGGGINIPDIEE